MNYVNYLEVNINNIKANLNYLKKEYKYKYYIFDVSNNAFNHGMYLINYIDIDYLYTNNLNDIYLIRKYNKDIPIILNTEIEKDNILDIINNNCIFLVDTKEKVEMFTNTVLYDNLNIILGIDTKGITGFNNKFIIRDIEALIKENNKLHIIGLKSSNITEKDYNDFQYITNNLLALDLKLYIFNDEQDKQKIKNSNALKLDYSIYGINNKPKLFKKEPKQLKQVLNLYSKITNIMKETKGKKTKYFGIIPFGYLNGMLNNINKVFIKNKLYNILEIKESYSIIEIDENIKINDLVEIIGSNNPLENYISTNTLIHLSIFNNLPKIYEDKLNEKTFIY